MKKIFVTLCFLCAFCLLLPAQTDIQRGVIHVQMKPESEQVVRQSVKRKSVGGIVQTGISKMDILNTRFRAVKMQPIFDIGGPFEERQRRYGLHLWYEISIDTTANPQEVAAAYLQSGEVETASPVHKIKRAVSEVIPYDATNNLRQQQSLTPNDPRFPEQWNFNNTGQPASKAVAGIDIRMPGAWAVNTGNPNVIVAVIDGGIDYTHPDLSENMWPEKGYNFINNTSNITFDDHGTHVAGVIAARNNNGIGVSGVAGGWGTERGVQLISCEIFEGDYTTATDANIAKAFQFAADNGAVIAQNSWSYDAPDVYDPVIKTGIAYFIDNAGKDNSGNPLPGTPMAGGIVFFVSGNEHSSNYYYPGADPKVFCVAAVGPSGKRAWYSNYNDAVDISAPGGDLNIANPWGGILSTVPGGYGWMHGTSMACPHVAGVAALVLSSIGSENYTPDMLRERLLNAVNPLDNAPEYAAGKMGAGLIDASKALPDANIPVTGIQISPTNAKLIVGDTVSISATIIPAEATNKNKTWESSDANIASVDNDGNVEAQKSGEAQITVKTNDGGYTATCVITVYEEAKIPQGFSPNGDGINDTFEMLLDSRETYALQVFDKSGQFYYQTDNYNNGWDGTANTGSQKGKKVLPGSYFYKLTAKQSGHVQTGYVVIRY